MAINVATTKNLGVNMSSFGIVVLRENAVYAAVAREVYHLTHEMTLS